MSQILKISLKLVLIITMIIQPVVFSYAMASVHHNHQISSQMSQNHDGDHNSTHEGLSHSEHNQNIDTESDLMGNCCASPACSGAMASSVSHLTSQTLFEYSPTINISRKGIVPSTEIKPPKRFSV